MLEKTVTGTELDRPEIHPLIANALHMLDCSDARWMLLRGSDDLAMPSGDVDLLVDGVLESDLDNWLAHVGFRRVIAPGHGDHRFYFAYSRDEDFWLKLDIVQSITFGPFQEWPTELSSPCLERRRTANGIVRPAVQDESWLFLLHLLLDKGTITPERRDRARAAAGLADADGPIGKAVDRYAAPGYAHSLLHIIGANDLQGLQPLIGRLRAGLTRDRPVRSRLTRVINRGRRRLLSPTLNGHSTRGLKVAVMGPDGAGKTTLLEGIGRAFPATSRYVYMGMWGASRWDSLMRRVPGGRIGQRLFRVLRASATARYHSTRGRLVLLDRVAYDAMLPGSIDTSVGGRISAFLVMHLSPTPDLLLVLDAPGEVMFARKGEHTIERLNEWRLAYLGLAAQVSGSVVMDATLPIDRVRSHAVAAVWERFSSPPTPFQSSLTEAAQ